MINARCNNRQEVVLELKPVDDNDPPQPVILDTDAVKISVVSGSSTASVSQKEDGSFEVVLRSSDSIGDTLFSIEGDAQPGEGVQIIAEQVNLSVTAPNAVSLGIGVLSIRTKSPLPGQ